MTLSPEAIATLRSERYNGTIIRLQKVHTDLLILRVQPDFTLPKHLPGQYCSLGLGNWEPRLPGCQEEALPDESESRLVRRPYSLSCSILGEQGELLDLEPANWLEFYVVLVRENPEPAKPPGLTPRLFMLQEGDRINIHPKITGNYTLEPVGEQDTVLFLSTGTGEAPHNYMVWDLLRRGHRGKIFAVCCVRYQRDLGYLKTQHKLMERFSNYQYIPLTTRELQAGEPKMYIQDLIDRGVLEEHLGHSLHPDSTHVFLCGNPSMIGIPHVDKTTGAKHYPQPTGVIELLEKRGFHCDDSRHKLVGNIHFEKYW